MSHVERLSNLTYNYENAHTVCFVLGGFADNAGNLFTKPGVRIWPAKRDTFKQENARMVQAVRREPQAAGAEPGDVRM